MTGQRMAREEVVNMSDKWQGNKRSYMGWVRDYARHFLACPKCGAEPTKYCTDGRGGDPANFVCPERWKIAYSEVTSPELKREWPHASEMRKPAKAEPAKPKSSEYTRADFTGKCAARKLREALAEDGVTMRKDGGLYLLVTDGRIRGPMTLGEAIEWAQTYGFSEVAQKFRKGHGLAA